MPQKQKLISQRLLRFSVIFEILWVLSLCYEKYIYKFPNVTLFEKIITISV